MTSGSIRIIALLDDQPLAYLAAAIDTSWTIRPCRTFAGVMALLRESPADVLVVSPSALATLPETGPAQLRCFPAASNLPIVVFTSTELLDIRKVYDAASAGWRFELSLWTRAGAVEGVRDAIRQALAIGLGATIAGLLIESRKATKPETASFIHDLFRRPWAYSKSESTISHADRTVATINISLADVGFHTFKVLRRCSRVAFCYMLMSRFGITASAASHRAGYGSVDAFERDVKHLATRTPGALVAALTEDDLIRLILAHCLIDESLLRADSPPDSGLTAQPLRSQLSKSPLFDDDAAAD